MLLKDLFCLDRNVGGGGVLEEREEQNKVSSGPLYDPPTKNVLGWRILMKSFFLNNVKF